MRAYTRNFMGDRLKQRNGSMRNNRARYFRYARATFMGGNGFELLEPRVMLDGSPFGMSSFTPLGDSPVILAGPTGLNGAPLLDLNHDGVGDMIVEYDNGIGTAHGGSSSVASISALLVNPDGSSTIYRIARYTIPSSVQLPIINQVLVTDVNNDGQPDVVVLRNTGGTLSTQKFVDVFLGHADGTFNQPTAPIDLGTYIGTPTLSVFDQNGDGKTDIFLEDGTKFRAYLGNNDGTFAAPVVSDFQTLLFPLSLNKLSTVTHALFEQDVTGDGIPDLVVSGEVPTFARTGTQYALYVFKGQASGSYNLSSPSFSETTDNLTLYSVQQLSSDDKPDIVAYSSTAGPDVASSIFVFRNSGSGTFTQSFHSPTFANGMPTIALGLNAPKQPLLTPDLTGDGVDDLILVEGGLGTNSNVTLHIEKNNGNAGFTETQQIPFISSPYDNSGLVEDVDGDGLPDLVVYSDVYPSVLTTIYFNHGGAVFDATGLVPVPSSAVLPGRAPGLADFNGDGKLDLIYTGSSVSLEVLLNTTGRAFGPGIDTSLSAPESGPNLVRYQLTPPDPILDYTGDLLPDLLSYNGDGFSILANTGDGHFTALKPYVGNGGATPIATDINHDGKIDLIWGPLPALVQFDENPPSIFVNINGATTPTDTAGPDLGTARVLGTLTGPIALDAFINTTWGDGNNLLHASDFYKFTLASPQVVRITAAAATGTVGLSLEDSSGTGIASTNGLLPVIDATLDAGTYYVAVANSDVVDTHYRLDIYSPPVLPSIGVHQGFTTIVNGQTSNVDFGSVLIATTDTHKDFTVFNEGDATLDLSAITFPTGFTISGTTPVSTLAAGASTTLTLVMTTSAPGQFSGDVTIPSPNPLVPDFVFPVSGNVTGPVTTDVSGQFASSPSLPGSIIAGESAPLSFTLSNAGPGNASGTYSVVFKLEKSAPQLGKGDVAAGNATGPLVVATGNTSDVLNGNFTVPANLASGTYYLAATITDNGGIDANAADKTFFSGAITVGPPATHLAFSTQPASSIVAGSPLGAVTVQVLDAANHVVASDASTITLTLTKPDGATLNGTTAVQVINGMATFNGLTVDQANSYSLTATDSALAAGVSKSFTITPDLSTLQLAVQVQPTGALVGQAFATAPVIAIEDQFHNIITSDKSKVTLSIFDGDGGTLAGTLVVSASGGKATFKGLSISQTGNYILQATDALLAAVHFDDAIVVGKATTALAKPKAPSSVSFGKDLIITGTLKSNAPSSIPFSGNVTLTDQVPDDFPPVTVNANGTFKFTLADLPGIVVPYSFTVHYAGDDNHTAIDSPEFPVTINLASTKLTLTTSASSLIAGQPITLTAVVTGSGQSTLPTGTIMFKDNGNLIQPVDLDENASASWTVDAPTPNGGTHHYTATYAGDNNFKAAKSSTKSVVVKADKTSILFTSSLPSPIAVNQSFNLSVHVSVLAPGNSTLTGIVVAIKDNGHLIGVPNLDSNGDASLDALTYNAAGSHKLTATFLGNDNTQAVTAPVLKLTIS